MGMAHAAPSLTKENGAPVADNQKSQAAGPGGSVLLQDFHLVEKLARFDRERVPERVVHARGVGAYGEFVSAGDLSAYTRASMLLQKGKKTPMFVRFSTVIHPSGSPETLRDPRGFALKFYTDQGNWDIVGNNLDVFFIRDAMKFPDMVHALKPSPVTNRQDPNRFFDFFQHVPESTHMLTQLYSDLGIPSDYRHVDGSSVHAFKLVNAKGEVYYAKFSWKTRQGLAFLETPEKVAAAQAKDFSHATKDLYDAIGRGDFPKWDLRAQIIPASKVNAFRFNPLDATKRWPEKEIPPVLLGTFTLNTVPPNFFQHSEQSAFSPGVLVPGVEPSEDALLQGRLFAYADTQRYRVGPNYQQLSVNAPRVPVRSNIQDGAMNFILRSGDVNYEPSSVAPLSETSATAAPTPPEAREAAAKTENFYQAGEFYRSLARDAQTRLVNNFAGDLKQVRSAEIKTKIVGYLRQADKEYGDRVAALVGIR
ncbi:catalase [Pendulispora rubella]|uniref:Catalase n=2 Tax=Pendulispora rubella TaxID=2741070 RepID=A0ABZ2LMB6_9BACT